jgi:hypothetical protein
MWIQIKEKDEEERVDRRINADGYVQKWENCTEK